MPILNCQVLDQLILDCRWAVEYGAFTPEGKEAKQVFEEGTMISMEDGKPTKQRNELIHSYLYICQRSLGYAAVLRQNLPQECSIFFDLRRSLERSP